MKISANEIKVGNILEFENKLWKVLKLEHTKPGKGGAYIQIEFKDINIGTKKNERFRSDENIEKAHLEQRAFQLLYSSGDEYFFMDQKNYEQISINKEKIMTDTLPYLKDGINVSLELKDDEPINILLPETATLKIKEAEAVIKNQTATSGLKPAILENGVKVYECTISPQHILSCDEIILTNAIQGIKWVSSYRTKRYFHKIADKLISFLNEDLKANY